MTELLNEAGFVGQVILGMNDITGSLFLTLFCILVILLVAALALRIPLEAISVLYLPLLITLTAYTSEFLALFGCFLIYAGIIIAKNLLGNR